MKKIGLIAGGGKFPIIFAKAAREKGVSIVAVACKEETSLELEKAVDKIYWISIAELKKLIGIFKSEGVKKAVMAGRVTKTRLFKDTPKPDPALESLLKNVSDKSDISLLRSAARVLRFFGITLIDSTIFLKDILPAKGILTKRVPTKEEWDDIKFGFSLAKATSRLEIGQTVVVKNKVILAIEAIEGTDKAILRGGELGNGSVVIVKTARPYQDRRFDIPTIGPDTIRSLKEAGGSVLAIEARSTIFIDKDECVSLADSNNLSLVVV